MAQIEPGTYRHYKGKMYEVLHVALHTETNEPVVVYKALYPCPELEADYGKDPWFVRPLAMFTEMILTDSGLQPRFVKV
ncbi:DUF1653 domain-containing protein [Chitinophagaceae bacterium MMS25-I14]